MIELNSERAKVSESQLTLELTIWFRENYPDTAYRVDIGADMPLPRIHRGRLKALHGKWSRGHVDFVIYASTKRYSGLHLELKTEKAGCPNTEHTRTQGAYHKVLRKNGYKAGFSIGFTDTVNTIKKYMKKVKYYEE